MAHDANGNYKRKQITVSYSRKLRVRSIVAECMTADCSSQRHCEDTSHHLPLLSNPKPHLRSGVYLRPQTMQNTPQKTVLVEHTVMDTPSLAILPPVLATGSFIQRQHYKFTHFRGRTPRTTFKWEWSGSWHCRDDPSNFKQVYKHERSPWSETTFLAREAALENSPIHTQQGRFSKCFRERTPKGPY